MGKSLSRVWYYQWAPGDWASDPRTRFLTLEQEGCIRRLMDIQFQADDCSLPNDPQVLAAWVGNFILEPANQIAVLQFFSLNKKNKLANEFIVNQKAYIQKKSKINSENGEKGGNASVKKRLRKKANASQTLSDRLSDGQQTLSDREANFNHNRTDQIKTDQTRSDQAENPDIEEVINSVVLNEVRDAWNVMASKCGLNTVVKLSDTRKTHLQARLKDPIFKKGWKQALESISTRPFLLGDNDRGWKIDFDFFIKPDSVVKIIEGKYQNKPAPPKEPAPLNRYTRFAKDRLEEIQFGRWDMNPETNPGEAMYQEYKAKGYCE